MQFVQAVAEGDAATVTRMLAADPTLATRRAEQGATRQEAKAYYLEVIEHDLYAPVARPQWERSSPAAPIPSARTRAVRPPMKLATHNTGRGGSGSPEAQAQQAEIVRLLEGH
jgi:hypothetical protein